MDFRIGTPSQYVQSNMVSSNPPNVLTKGSYFLIMKDRSASLIAKLYNDSFIIRSVEVRPDRRGQGIGTHIVRQMIQFLLPKRKPIFLYVDPSNAPAIHVYTKLGFVRIKQNTAFGDKYVFRGQH
uniref:N-acetyltransferase domain-containing protein n=1 Tax=viral metagenome TaxID=1070528 RepID=A0A6C0JVL5_9ZZZZ